MNKPKEWSSMPYWDAQLSTKTQNNLDELSIKFGIEWEHIFFEPVQSDPARETILIVGEYDGRLIRYIRRETKSRRAGQTRLYGMMGTPTIRVNWALKLNPKQFEAFWNGKLFYDELLKTVYGQVGMCKVCKRLVVKKDEVEKELCIHCEVNTYRKRRDENG